MSKRKNTFTRFIEDIVNDTKDFADDILDRAKDLETDMKDAVKDDDDNVSVPSLHSLESALAELTAKVNQLTQIQLAPAAKRKSSASAAA